ncbi:Rossmann-fold NAD(P)-binding domain-containing protein [Mesorhizobium xinjiangense]|uniref:NmrA family transcriptional regulator n=1 Tax=Mesorhizobium xinjiangense TaxID=2678685 RepID=UPI0012EDE9DC|nr:NmrA family transcriptional regulator [Mesorhizobium xinjiangense]
MSTRHSSHSNSKPVLVIGGTGKTGRRVAQRLAERDQAVRIGSRAAEPAFDWNNAATWRGALDAARAAYITYQPDLAVPGAVEAIDTFARLAVQMGVRRLVLLSGRGEPEAQASERALVHSGAEWTIIRASWFAQNFSESFLLDAILSDEVALPVGDVREPFIDVDDIAEIAAAALSGDGHTGQLYEVTGPRLMTFAQAVDEIARASGRDVRYRRVEAADYAAALRAQAVPPDTVELVMMLLTEVLDGRNASLSDGVEKALGRPPRDFSDYVRRTVETGVWDDVQQTALGA